MGEQTSSDKKNQQESQVVCGKNSNVKTESTEESFENWMDFEDDRVTFKSISQR